MVDKTSLVKNAKSFWDSKEGTTGRVIGAGILGLLGWGAYTIMPYIANLMQNLFYALGFGALCVFLIYALVIDGTLRNRMWLIYKLLMRALTYQIISYDPVGVLRETQEIAAKRIATIDKNRIDVNKSVMSLKATIAKFTKQKEQLIAQINVMQRQGRSQEDVANEAMKVGRLDEAITRTDKSYTMTSAFYAQLTKAQKAAETIHSNIDFEIDVSEEEYKAATSASNAWRAVRSAFKGGDDNDLLQANAFAVMADDYAFKLGEIDSFMADSQKFIESVDLQNAVYTDKGLQLLENLNARDLSVVHTQTMLPSAQPAVIVPISNSSTGVDYSIYKK
jgi:hypothetical protein